MPNNANPDNPTIKAGQGNPHQFLITNSGQQNPITLSEQLYLGIDAVSWFVNDGSDIFSSNTATGVLEIDLGDGQENYQVGLGTYDLANNDKIAPVFGKAVLPDRKFTGSTVTITASIVMRSKDTSFDTILKSAGTASLGIVAGAVGTATAAGPSGVLLAAGSSLIGSVKDLLSTSGNGQQQLFTTNGIETTLKNTDVIGPYMYLLLHRGTDINQANLTVQTSPTGIIVPFYNGAILLDGVWLLLRLRVSQNYSGINSRPWASTKTAFENSLKTLVQNFNYGITTQAQAQLQLKPGPDGNSTVFDQFSKVRSLVETDEVLSDADQDTVVQGLIGDLNAALKIVNGAPAPSLSSMLIKR